MVRCVSNGNIPTSVCVWAGENDSKQRTQRGYSAHELTCAFLQCIHATSCVCQYGVKLRKGISAG